MKRKIKKQKVNRKKKTRIKNYVKNCYSVGVITILNQVKQVNLSIHLQEERKSKNWKIIKVFRILYSILFRLITIWILHLESLLPLSLYFLMKTISFAIAAIVTSISSG